MWILRDKTTGYVIRIELTFDEDDPDLARLLGALRKHLGMTQQALAEAIGVSRKALGEYERGNAAIPRQTMLAVLCLCLWATLSLERAPTT